MGVLIVPINDEKDVNDDRDGRMTITSAAFPTTTRPVGLFERAVTPNHDTYRVDSNFFSDGYSLFAMTGKQVWPGARLVVEALTAGWCQTETRNDNAHNDKAHHGGMIPNYNNPTDALKIWQDRFWKQQQQPHHDIKDIKGGTSTKPLRILELGSGIGFLGTALAAAGAHVTMTDLSVLVEYWIRPNIRRNAAAVHRVKNTQTTEAPANNWLSHATRIGHGYADGKTLDWTKPVQQQLSDDSLQGMDLIVACDCLLLVSLLTSFCDTLQSLFDRCMNASCLLTYQPRSPNSLYTTFDQVLLALQDRGWTVSCLAWRRVCMGKYDNGQDEWNDVYLIQVDK